jgi:hypothetical protein
MITLSEGLAVGDTTWWIQTWNPDGFGPWSDGMTFTVAFAPTSWAYRILEAARRFQVVLGGLGVLDRQTGLTWTRTTSGAVYSWGAAQRICAASTAASAPGWRLPSIYELRTLVPLPSGHPFTSVEGVVYWSATTNLQSTTSAYTQSTSTSTVVFSDAPKTDFRRAWCVRGGSGHGTE